MVGKLDRLRDRLCCALIGGSVPDCCGRNECPVYGTLGRIFTGRGIWDAPERVGPAACNVRVEGSSTATVRLGLPPGTTPPVVP
jgi:hypothetical protein